MSAIGADLATPDNLLSDVAQLLPTSATRLPLDWTTLCGRRPVALGAAPVPGTDLHLICASTEGLPDLELISCAADAIGRLRNVGSLTAREIRSSEELRSLVNNLPVPLVFVDSRSFEVFFNEPARLLLRFSSDELSNRKVSARLARLVAEEYPTARGFALANDTHGDLSFGIEREGRSYQVESKWVDDGIMLGRVWLFRDVTKEQAAALIKDQLVATVSHELRTPLTAIIASLGLMQMGAAGDLTQEALRLVNLARKNSDRLVKIVNDLLDMEKIQSGKMSYDLQPYDLRRLIADAVDQNAPYAQAFGVSLRSETPDVPVMVQADTDRISQVLANLISNAAKFSPPNSEVLIKLECNEAKACLNIIDQGRGISEQFRGRLFTRFAQDGESTVPGQAGSGLGLAISKGIIEAHGGDIWLAGSSDSGSTFRIDLPIDS
ncbi:MAG: ATP-binding protein [Erythrobacter sp.]|nr:ATP-binding protein [Erythrobacter sp.]MDZ4272646.1 ATP-binding protein [Erythrobacter sp.]